MSVTDVTSPSLGSSREWTVEHYNPLTFASQPFLSPSDNIITPRELVHPYPGPDVVVG